MIHSLKERTPKEWVAKCGVRVGAKFPLSEANMTAWGSHVTCPICLANTSSP